MNLPSSRGRRIDFAHSPVSAGGATGTSVGGSAALAPAPRVVRRLAGLSAFAAEAERCLRLELLEAAEALRVDMAGSGLARRNLSCLANAAV